MPKEIENQPEKSVFGNLLVTYAGVVADAIAGDAERQLEKAVADGDDLPAVKVVLSIVIGKSGNAYTIEADGKSERKQVAKTEKIATEYDPTQPGLFDNADDNTRTS